MLKFEFLSSIYVTCLFFHKSLFRVRIYNRLNSKRISSLLSATATGKTGLVYTDEHIWLFSFLLSLYLQLCKNKWPPLSDHHASFSSSLLLCKHLFFVVVLFFFRLSELISTSERKVFTHAHVDDDTTCLLFHTIGEIIIHTARTSKNLMEWGKGINKKFG
jgi:hypothetical protein